MSVQVENLEKNMAKLTIEVSAEELEKALQGAYLKQKNNISIPGFRKGKVPRAMVEKMYGAGIFYEDAANALIPEAYSNAVAESKLDVVSQPEVNVVQIEKGKPFIFTAEVAVKPEVTLGEYKGLEVPKADLTVTEEEIEAELKKEQEKNGRTIDVEDRPAQMGDTVTIDFEGSVDGVPFEGGAGKDYPLTLGSNTFIPGFEEQLAGVKLEEEVDVNVTFPEDYNAEELKGKAAVFKCTIHKIETKELPELDDDFAKDVSEFDTLDEYKADVKANLEKKKEADAKRAKEDAAVEKAVANASMEIPDAMVKSQAAQMVDNFVRRLQAQGMSMEQYMQYTGQTLEQMQDQMKPQATKQIQTRLVLEKVAEVENIEASEEKIDGEIQEMAKMYNMEADKLKELLGDFEKEQMKKDLAVQEAVTFLADHAVEVDAPEKTEE
ncbi:trigger factor [Wansuia hejianensis]|uniref:Trigger factor n=1 Tax=Wansuia hejianensis TaxID=2763667 RepID=A0A7G9GH46_9FIRM|nr:trigger factor [Wansuia hejianensis]QNM10128.1 trigger factor [Wansuia hejianensis]RHV89121.1 trigger factor [Lachnospiraceae bacterium OF09-33XD]